MCFGLVSNAVLVMKNQILVMYSFVLVVAFQREHFVGAYNYKTNNFSVCDKERNFFFEKNLVNVWKSTIFATQEKGQSYKGLSTKTWDKDKGTKYKETKC